MNRAFKKHRLGYYLLPFTSSRFYSSCSSREKFDGWNFASRIFLNKKIEYTGGGWIGHTVSAICLYSYSVCDSNIAYKTVIYFDFWGLGQGDRRLIFAVRVARAGEIQ